MLMCVRKMFGKCSTIWPKCPSLYQKSLSFNIHVYSDLKFRLHTTERGRFLRLQNIPPYFWERLCSNSADTRIRVFQLKLQKDFLLTRWKMSESVPLNLHPRQYPSEFPGAMAMGRHIHRPTKMWWITAG